MSREDLIQDDVQTLNQAWPRITTFFDALATLIRHNNGQEQAVAALVSLESKYGRNIVFRFSKLANLGRHDFWILKDIFGKALPFLNTTPASLLHCLVSLQKASKGDMAANWILGEIREMAGKQPDFAEDFIEHVFRHPASGAVFLSSLLVGLSTYRFNAAVNLVEQGLASKNQSIRLEAIYALGCLAYKGHEARAQEACEQLAAIAGNSADKCAGTAVAALGQLLHQLPVRVGQAIMAIASSGPRQARGSMPYVLSCAINNHGEAWFRKTLLDLADLNVDQLPQGNWLDMVLSDCCRRKDTICLEFLDKWLLLHPDESVSTAFATMITQLGTLDHTDWLANRIPLWFSHRQNFTAWRLADELLQHYARCGNAGQAPCLSYASDALDLLSLEDIHFLIRKTIAFTFVYPRLLCSTVISCLSCRNNRKQVDYLVFNYFIQIIGRNYLGTTEEILKSSSRSGSSRKNRVAKSILNHLHAFYSQLQNLPLLNESRPPTERWAAYAKSRSETFSKSAKKAEEHSILKAIATTVPMKYGCKFMFRFNMPGETTNQRLTDPSPLKKLQVSFEWPRKSNLDPVGLDYFLTVCRGETEVSV